jgi:hypothetical protein
VQWYILVFIWVYYVQFKCKFKDTLQGFLVTHLVYLLPFVLLADSGALFELFSLFTLFSRTLLTVFTLFTLRLFVLLTGALSGDIP